MDTRKSYLIKYKLSIALMVVAVLIMIGTTIAYFGTNAIKNGPISFGKISINTNTPWVEVVSINNALANEKLTKQIYFSKSVDSEDMYVRAKVCFGTDSEVQEVKDLVANLNNNQFAIKQSPVGAVFEWSERFGDIYYLMVKDSENNMLNLNDLQIIVLTDGFYLPADLLQTPNYAQYMEQITLRIEIQAIQSAGLEDLAFEEIRTIFSDTYGESVNYDVIVNSSSNQLGAVVTRNGKVLDINSQKLHIGDVIIVNVTNEDNTKYYDIKINNQSYENGSVYYVEDDVEISLSYLETTDSLVYTLSESGDYYIIGDNSVNFGNGLTDSWEGGVLVIPSQYNGLPVTTIGRRAFGNVTNVTEIYISEGITTINTQAFICAIQVDPNGMEYNDNGVLKHVSLPSTLETMGTIENSHMFWGRTGLTSITIPEKVTYLGYATFYMCISLTEVIMPGVVVFGEFVFYHCTQLTEVEIPVEVVNIPKACFYECYSLQELKLHNQVKSIGYASFSSCLSFKEIEIPASVTTIEKEAFLGCSNVETVTIADNSQLTSLAIYVFSSMNSLKTFNWGANAIIETIPNFLFSNSSSLENITLPASVKTLGSYVFYGNKQLREFTISEGVTSIGDRLFYLCDNLRSVNIPSSVTSIGGYSFEGCINLTEIDLSANTEFTSIGTNAFKGCYNLASISLPSSLTTVGANAFSECYKLVHIVNNSVTALTGLPSNLGQEIINQEGSFVNTLSAIDENGYRTYQIGDNKYLFSYSGDANSLDVSLLDVDAVYPYALYSNKSIISVALPNTVTTIGENAFVDCGKLVRIITGVSMTAGVEYTANIGMEIGSVDGFVNTLQTSEDGVVTYIINQDGEHNGKVFVLDYVGTGVDMVLSNSITDIYDYAFYKNIIFTSIVLSENLNTIGKFSFSYSTGLNEIVIPASVTSINEKAFFSATNINKITFNSEVACTLGNSSFAIGYNPHKRYVNMYSKGGWANGTIFNADVLNNIGTYTIITYIAI